MKKHHIILCMVCTLACIFTTSLFAQIYLEDSFDSNHVYFDGTTVDVGGTQWDGIFGTQFLDFMNANISNASTLTLKLKSTGDATAIDGTNYRFPLLYKDITGDFIAEMEFKNPIPEEYIIHLLCCVDMATSNDYMAGAFPMAPVWGFWDYHAAHTAGERVLDAGVGPFVASNLCFQIVRAGDTFTTSSRLNPSSNWSVFGQYTHPETLPATLSVGLSVAEHVLHGYTYEVEYCVISDIPEPGLFGILALGMLFLVRRK